MRKLIAPILGFMFVEFIGWFSGIFTTFSSNAKTFICGCNNKFILDEREQGASLGYADYRHYPSGVRPANAGGKQGD